MTTISKKLGISGEPPSLEPSSFWIIPHQKVGIEIEVENCNPRTGNRDILNTWWESKEDGSLRNNGREWITRGGLLGKDLLNAISAWETGHGRMWDTNYRTGLHIHLDVSSMDMEAFSKLCALYALAEKMLFGWVGDNRESNINCLPWWKAQGDLRSIAFILNDTTAPSGFTRAGATISRYAALNLGALGRYGTIEFRHMQATHDMERLKTWINLCMSLRFSAEVIWKDKSPSQLAECALDSPQDFFARTFGRSWGALEDGINPQFSASVGAPIVFDIIEADKLRA